MTAGAEICCRIQAFTTALHLKQVTAMLLRVFVKEGLST